MYKTSYIICIVCCCVWASSCGKHADTDSQGRLLAGSLTGNLNFSPMQHSDSAYVQKFLPDTLYHKGKPYTGQIAAYDAQKRLTMEGALENGIATGHWIFYYPSGSVHIEGNYREGMETGLWTSYYAKDHPDVVKYYDANGYMLMRTEFYDNKKVKNYQNIKCPQYGNRARRIELKRDGSVDYIDAEKSVSGLSPRVLNDTIAVNGFMEKQ